MYFIDYIFYRITKLYYREEGDEEGITALVIIALVGVLVTMDVAFFVSLFFLTPSEKGFLPIWGKYTIVPVYFLFLYMTKKRYKDEYWALEKRWENISFIKSMFLNLSVLLIIILPILVVAWLANNRVLLSEMLYLNL